MKNIILLFSLLVLFFSLSSAISPLYDQMKTDIINLNVRNFDTQITKLRSTGGVSIVQFYTGGDGKSQSLKQKVQKFASQVKGIFKVGAVNCESDKSLCESKGFSINQLPIFRVYPPVPIPDFSFQGEFDKDKLKKTAASYIQTPTITQITSNNLQPLITANNGIPLSLLFTKSKGTPLLYKALAKDFKDTLIFGIARQDQVDLMQKFNIKKVPALIIVEDLKKKKPMRFEGNFNHHEAFEFLNSKSEVFITGDEGKIGGKQIIDLKQKPWLQQNVPQLSVQSQQELCFSLLGEGNNICMIIVQDKMPSDEQVKIFTEIRAYYEPKIQGRGTNLRLSFLNLSVEKEWKDFFNFQGTKDRIVFIKGKKNRLRYFAYEGDFGLQNIKTAIDNMMGGSVKFNNIKQKPNFLFTFEQPKPETDL